jgi:hypothetical protein
MDRFFSWDSRDETVVATKSFGRDLLQANASDNREFEGGSTGGAIER